MVSQSPSFPQKISPLSYADRAKKAQNIRSPIALHPLPSSNPPPTQANSASQSPKADTLQINGTTPPSSDVTLDSSRTPMSPTPTDASDELVKTPASNDLATKALSIVAAHTSPQKTPVVNCWDVRREQMAAAARSAQQQKQQHDSHSTTTHSTAQSSSSLEDHSTPNTTAPNSASALNSSHAGSGPSASALTNGGDTGAEGDPFVVRIYAKPLIPPVIDVDSWPEVGKPVSSAHQNGSVHAGDPHHPPHEANKADHHLQISHTHSRKSEKTKWVPIPPEELQAAADAQAREAKRQHHPPPPRMANSTKNNHNTYASGSTHRQGQSKPQSASHSRMQSCSGSVQSSPRMPRPRRLPGEDGNGQTNHSAQPRHHAAVSSANHNQLITTGDHRHRQHSHHHHQQQQSSHPIPVHSHSHGRVMSQDGWPAAYPQYMHHPTTAAAGFQSSRDGTPPPPPPPPLPYTYPQQGYTVYGPLPYGHGRASYDYHAHMSGSLTQYGYWNGHGSQPGSGYHSPVYVPPQQQGYHHQPPPQPQRRRGGGRREPEGEEAGVEHRRPPPPEESLAVAGYREGEEGERKVVFGSIGNSRCATPPNVDETVGGEGEKQAEFVMPVSIGVLLGDAHLPRSKSRSRTRNGVGRTKMKVIDLTEKEGGGGGTGEARWEFGTVTSAVEGCGEVDGSGEAGNGEEGEEARSLSPLSDKPQQMDTSVLDRPGAEVGLYELPATLGSSGETASSAILDQSASPSVCLHQGVGASSPSELQKRLEQLTGVPRLATLDEPGRDVFEVQDFGFGFGSRSRGSVSPVEQDQRQQTGLGPTVNGGVKVGGGQGVEVVTQQGDDERERGDEDRDMEKRDMEVPVRLRRGSAPNIEPGGYAPHGERGGYAGRRGRNAYGRGGGHRRGASAFNTLQPQHPHQHPHQHPRGGMPPPPFGVVPTQGLFRPIPMGGDRNGFYPTFGPAQMSRVAGYMPTGYEGYLGALPPLTTNTAGGVLPPRLAAAAAGVAPPLIGVGASSLTGVVGAGNQHVVGASNPPVAVPVSPVAFPLDSTRWYLLGQLEYYLSPQNLAQDFFLRQRMDAKGWVPITLIASFNRVRQFGAGLQAVKELLMLSSVVEVKDEWVRMNGWERFVLPDAAKSMVEAEEEEEQHGGEGGVGGLRDADAEGGGVGDSQGAASGDGNIEDSQGTCATNDTVSVHQGNVEDALHQDDCDAEDRAHAADEGAEVDAEVEGEEAEEDDDEDDVVFVMDSQAEPSTSWPPSSHT